jgi:hypothetical protein
VSTGEDEEVTRPNSSIVMETVRDISFIQQQPRTQDTVEDHATEY